VDETWYEYAENGYCHGVPVRYVPAEELIWCKTYVQNRERNDSADINHLLLKTGHRLDWARLWKRLDTHWHLLLAQLLIFQFVYPSEYRNIVPDWLFLDRKSTRLNSSHVKISYAVFCLKKKTKTNLHIILEYFLSFPS